MPTIKLLRNIGIIYHEYIAVLLPSYLAAQVIAEILAITLQEDKYIFYSRKEMELIKWINILL